MSSFPAKGASFSPAIRRPPGLILMHAALRATSIVDRELISRMPHTTSEKSCSLRSWSTMILVHRLIVTFPLKPGPSAGSEGHCESRQPSAQMQSPP